MRWLYYQIDIAITRPKVYERSGTNEDTESVHRFHKTNLTSVLQRPSVFVLRDVSRALSGQIMKHDEPE